MFFKRKDWFSCFAARPSLRFVFQKKRNRDPVFILPYYENAVKRPRIPVLFDCHGNPAGMGINQKTADETSAVFSSLVAAESIPWYDKKEKDGKRPPRLRNGKERASVFLISNQHLIKKIDRTLSNVNRFPNSLSVCPIRYHNPLFSKIFSEDSIRADNQIQ